MADLSPDHDEAMTQPTGAIPKRLPATFVVGIDTAEGVVFSDGTIVLNQSRRQRTLSSWEQIEKLFPGRSIRWL